MKDSELYQKLAALERTEFLRVLQQAGDDLKLIYPTAREVARDQGWEENFMVLTESLLDSMQGTPQQEAFTHKVYAGGMDAFLLEKELESRGITYHKDREGDRTVFVVAHKDLNECMQIMDRLEIWDKYNKNKPFANQGNQSAIRVIVIATALLVLGVAAAVMFIFLGSVR